MSDRLLMDQALRAAREGRAIYRSLVDQTATDSFVVETGAGTYYDIPEGKQVIVTCFWVGCGSPNESVAGYMVSCSETGGGGNATTRGLELHDHVGDKKDGSGHIKETLSCPLCVKYSDGARSVSMAIKATDSDTICLFGWCGWVEDEGTLS